MKSCHLPTDVPTPGLLATLDSAIHLHFNSPTRATLIKSSVDRVTFCSATSLLPIPCQCPHDGFRATCSLLLSHLRPPHLLPLVQQQWVACSLNRWRTVLLKLFPPPWPLFPRTHIRSSLSLCHRCLFSSHLDNEACCPALTTLFGAEPHPSLSSPGSGDPTLILSYFFVSLLLSCFYPLNGPLKNVFWVGVYCLFATLQDGRPTGAGILVPLTNVIKLIGRMLLSMYVFNE